MKTVARKSDLKGFVSVVIPCYNKGALVMETVKSILRSTVESYEIIIVNDGSTDTTTVATLAKIKKYYPQVNIINTKNQGVAAARNTGVSAAKGEFVLFLDNDDLIDRKFIERGADFLSSHQEVDFIFPETVFFKDKLGIGFEKEFNLYRLRFSSYIPISCIHRKKHLEQITFDPEWKMIEDLDFLIKLAKKQKIGRCLRNSYLFYRVDTDSRNNIEESYFSRRKKINVIYQKNKVSFSLKETVVNLLIEVFSVFSHSRKTEKEKEDLKKVLEHDDYLRNEIKELKINLEI